MRASRFLIPTEKDDPQEAVVASHRLMIRAGLVRKTASGLYSYLPMGLRILKKIESIVRDEMNKSGALEFQLPILTPSDFWKESGRWETMGKEMFRLKDRHENENCLGPTHEETFCTLMRPMLRSYKDLPINVYQIHTKFRDEIRPRFGVIRSREFTMKDAYSFHLDESSLEDTYQAMRQTYRNIFDRLGLKTIPVQADSGNMGGSASEEFMVVSPIGEETLTLCKKCGYAGNVEKTPVPSNPEITTNGKIEAQLIDTPNVSSIPELVNFFKKNESDFLKSVLVISDQKSILVFMSGERDLNENKLKNFLKSQDIYPMPLSKIEDLGLVPGFIGPGFSSKDELEVYYDTTVVFGKSYIVGANQKDKHKLGVTLNKEDHWTVGDFSKSIVGDPCPSCSHPLHQEKGIEVGHIFKLGQKYSNSFHLQVLNQTGKPTTTTMGCYGIGVNRCMATIIEQSNDDKGISWPLSVAPFSVILVSIAKAPQDIKKIETFYSALQDANIDVLWDDRDLGPGFKFKDAELIGFPIRITMGKNFFEKNEISFLNRKTMKEESFTISTPMELLEKTKIAIDLIQKEEANVQR